MKIVNHTKRKSTGRFNPHRIVENIIGIVMNIPIFGCYWFVFVAVQHSQTQHKCKDKMELKYATYSEFKTALQRGDWKVDSMWEKSLFAKDDKNYDTNYIHAGVYIIDGVGYLLTSYGLIRSKHLINSTIKKLKK